MAVQVTIYSGITDGYVSATDTNWSAIRDANTGSSVNFINPNSTTAVRASATTARGVTTSVITRSFFSFDVSSITHVPKFAELQLYGLTNGNSDVIVVKSDWTGILSTADYDSIVGWDGTNSTGLGHGDESSNVTQYSREINTWDTSSYNRIILTQAALVDLAGESSFVCCVMDYDYDLRDIAATSAVGYTGLWYSNALGTSKDTKLVITTQDDSVFFGANF